jgi:hypothetical protein
MYASFRRYLKDMTVIGAYEPTIDHSEQEMEAFYEAVEKLWMKLLKIISKSL